MHLPSLRDVKRLTTRPAQFGRSTRRRLIAATVLMAAACRHAVLRGADAVDQPAAHVANSRTSAGPVLESAPRPASRDRLISSRAAAMLAGARPKLEAAKSVLVPAAAATAPNPILVKPPPRDDGIVVMEPFEVNDRLVPRQLSGLLEYQHHTPPESFSPEKGGTLFRAGPAEVKFKYSAQHAGWDILNIRF